jgi:hypothetical protein
VMLGSGGGRVSDGPGVSSVSHAYKGPTAANDPFGPWLPVRK